MSKRKRFKQDDPGPNPDPKRYILVQTKEGSYWRLRRGLNKPALLNSRLQQSVEATRICSPAAKRVRLTLWQHLGGLKPGRLIARSSALLKKAFQKKGSVDFSFFKDFDFQPDHPFNNLLQAPYKCRQKDGVVQLQIPIDEWSMKKHNALVTDYYFDLVLLSGDPTKDDGLNVESVTSPLFQYATRKKSTCTLSIRLPETKESWMAMLKVNSHEGNELAVHPKHYGMKVVAYGH